MAEQLDPDIGWSDVDRLREQWRGPLLIKGLLHPDEAREAMKRGADGIIVSNHGGRQLDGAVASIRALPGIVAAVEGRAPVLIDGGFRRGVDVIKALALGARAVLIGRPHLWGVACGGEEGVLWVLELFRREIDRALALGGWDGVARLDPSIFFRRRDWARPRTHLRAPMISWALTPPLRNFFRVGFRGRDARRLRHEDGGRRPLRFGRRRGPKQRKRKEFFRLKNETRGFAAGVVSH